MKVIFYNFQNFIDFVSYCELLDDLIGIFFFESLSMNYPMQEKS